MANVVAPVLGQCGKEAVELLCAPFGHKMDGAIGPVLHVAAHRKTLGDLLSAVPKSDALHAAGVNHLAAFGQTSAGVRHGGDVLAARDEWGQPLNARLYRRASTHSTLAATGPGAYAPAVSPPKPLVSRLSGARLLWAVALVAAAPAAWGQTATTGVLVLRNGRVLAGAIHRTGDQYQITAEGVTLQAPADQVERFAASLAEAYQGRRQDIDPASADAHLELGRWCVHVGLLDDAARELLDARSCDATNPGVAALERTLGEMLRREAAARRDVAGTAGPQEPAEVPANSEAPPEDVAVLDLSAEAQVQFVRTIQPMLIRNCTTGGCHQTSSGQQLRLDRWALQGRGNPEVVRRNLQSVLAAINRDDPEASALVRRGRTPHGDGTVAASRPLSVRQAELLLAWTYDVAGMRPEVAAAPAAASAASGAAAVDEASAQGAGIGAGEIDLGRPLPAGATGFVPRDEFDAEIFHRRMSERAASDAPAVEREKLEATGDQPLEPAGSPGS